MLKKIAYVFEWLLDTFWSWRLGYPVGVKRKNNDDDTKDSGAS